MEQKFKETEDLLYSTKNQRTVADSMVQFNNILSLFNSTRNQYLQLREEEDEADTWFEDVDNWVFEFKFTTGWRKDRDFRMSTKRSNHSGKSRGSKICYCSLIQKSEVASKSGKLKKGQNLLNFKQRYNSWNNCKEQKNKQRLLRYTRRLHVPRQVWRSTIAMTKSTLKKVQSHHK